MQRFRRMKTMQKFAAVISSIDNYSNSERSLYNQRNFNANCAAALDERREFFAA